MKRRSIWILEILGIAILALGVVLAATLEIRHKLSMQSPADAAEQSIAGFLQHYWRAPLPTQGPAPKTYSPLEASLAPQACGTCHRQQYVDWRSSLMSRSIGPGLLWQFRSLPADQAMPCLRCHAPLAEQRLGAAQAFGWPQSGASLPGADPQLFHAGVTCAACHLRRQRRFGPPPEPRTPPVEAAGLAHGGFIPSPAFEDSRFCATCHQSPPDARALAGLPFENTYAEWRASRFAREGIHCQSCHMPDREHLWRGIHDPAMVRSGLRIALQVTRVDATTVEARAIIRNVAVGHDFPTYVVPAVQVRMYASGPATQPREVARQTIGRCVNLHLDHQFFDTRIPPEGARVLQARFDLRAYPASQVRLHIEVSPGAHYARLYRHELAHAQRYAGATVALLKQALAQAATRYTLLDLVAAVPASIGAARQARAEPGPLPRSATRDQTPRAPADSPP